MSSNKQQQQQQNDDDDSSIGWRRLVKTVQTGVQKKQESIRVAREAKQAGQVYNPKTKEWYFYLLEEEWRELQNVEKQKSTLVEKEEEREVADREYYDLLQVRTNADATEIKRAYYKIAKQCHPDKNPNDETAHEKFQQLGHAYQILSNEQSRAAYDKNGKPDSTEETAASDVDPFVFFNVMFGSALVEPYIGELWLASHTDSMMNDSSGLEGLEDESIPEEERRRMYVEKMKQASDKNKLDQRKRQVKCAMNLRDRIKDYDESKPAEFVEGCRQEALKIVAGAYGALYCVTIGFPLQVAAEEYLGFESSFLGLAGHLARTKKNASGFASGFKLLGAGIKAASAGSKAMREAEDMQMKAAEKASMEGGEKDFMPEEQETDKMTDEAKMAETLDESLPAFLEFAWAINKRDIQSTLKESCQKLFSDASVPKEMRIYRARAVQILGREFQAIGKLHQLEQSKDFHPEDIKARVAVAAMTTMAKAQGQEVTEQDQEEMMQQAKQMPSPMGENDDDAEESGEDATTTETTEAKPNDSEAKDATTKTAKKEETKTDAHDLD